MMFPIDAIGIDESEIDAIGDPATAMDAIGIDAIGDPATAMDAIGMDAIGMDAIGMDAIGMDAIGMDAIGAPSIPIEASVASATELPSPSVPPAHLNPAAASAVHQSVRFSAPVLPCSGSCERWSGPSAIDAIGIDAMGLDARPTSPSCTVVSAEGAWRKTSASVVTFRSAPWRVVPWSFASQPPAVDSGIDDSGIPPTTSRSSGVSPIEAIGIDAIGMDAIGIDAIGIDAIGADCVEPVPPSTAFMSIADVGISCAPGGTVVGATSALAPSCTVATGTVSTRSMVIEAELPSVPIGSGVSELGCTRTVSWPGPSPATPELMIVNVADQGMFFPASRMPPWQSPK